MFIGLYAKVFLLIGKLVRVLTFIIDKLKCFSPRILINSETAHRITKQGKPSVF